METALSMVYMGANGNYNNGHLSDESFPLIINYLYLITYSGATASEMATGMNYENPEPTAVAAKVGGVAKSYQAEGSPVSIANKVYLMNGYEVKAEFNEIATKSFDSETESVNFADSAVSAKNINGWVEQKTHNKIKDLIDPSLLDGLTRMVLVNAIYFKGNWAKQFNKERTEKADFWTSETDKKQVDMMYVKDHFKYGHVEELDAAVIELPYANSTLSMMVILPTEKTGLAKAEAGLANMDLSEISKRLHKMEVNVYMPKFKVEYDLSLKKPLEKVRREGQRVWAE